MNKIAVIGSTGLLGKPVTMALAGAGMDVRALVRNPGPARQQFPSSIRIVPGDLRGETDVSLFLKGREILYLNLSVKQDEKPADWHSEREGMVNILAAAKQCGIRRIFYLSSLVQRYQGMNGFDWWVFRVKLEAIRMIRASGIPSTIFYPSTFMEAISSQYMQGNRLLLAGKSRFGQHFIASQDFAKQVVKAVETNREGDKDYVIQGPEAYTTDEALRIFKEDYTRRKLSISSAPLGMIRFFGKFNQKMNYGAHILEALNEYPEQFEAEETWKELGKPAITLREFAATVS